MAKMAYVSARVDQDTLNALNEIVAVSPGDRSDHIRQALDIYIQEQRKQSRFLRALAAATMADGEASLPA